MSNFNKVVLIGRLGRDPERKQTKAGKEFSSFSMATSEKWAEEEKTQWHNVVVWNEVSARYVNDYAKTGALVLVEGSIEYRQWEKPDGSIGYMTDIVVGQYNGTVEILKDAAPREGGQARPATRPTRKEGYRQVTRQQKPEPQTVFEEDLDDEIPF